MSDLIKREDAIKAVENVSENYTKEGDREWHPHIDFIIQSLVEVPSISSADRWIPCSERLPSENGDYLVTLENGVVKILGYSTTQRTTYPKGFYYIKEGFSWRQVQNPVIAWMPLSKPWKGADDE